LEADSPTTGTPRILAGAVIVVDLTGAFAVRGADWGDEERMTAPLSSGDQERGLLYAKETGMWISISSNRMCYIGQSTIYILHTVSHPTLD